MTERKVVKRRCDVDAPEFSGRELEIPIHDGEEVLSATVNGYGDLIACVLTAGIEPIQPTSNRPDPSEPSRSG